MEINEDQYETLQTIFPDHAIDILSFDGGLTIKVWGNPFEEDNVYDLESVREVRFTDE